MTDWYGYEGRVLFVDLGEGTSRVEPLDERLTSPCQAVARKPQGGSEAAVNALAHPSFRSNRDGRRVTTERGAEAHLRRKHPMMGFGRAIAC